MSRPACLHCDQPLDPIQVTSGLTWKDQAYYGHYRCVVKALGLEALPAVQAGALPLYRDDDLDAEGRLPKMVKRYGRGQRPTPVVQMLGGAITGSDLTPGRRPGMKEAS